MDTQNGGRGGRAEEGGGGWERHKYLREFKRKPNTEEEGKRRRGGKMIPVWLILTQGTEKVHKLHTSTHKPEKCEAKASIVLFTAIIKH